MTYVSAPKADTLDESPVLFVHHKDNDWLKDLCIESLPASDYQLASLSANERNFYQTTTVLEKMLTKFRTLLETKEKEGYRLSNLLFSDLLSNLVFEAMAHKNDLEKIKKLETAASYYRQRGRDYPFMLIEASHAEYLTNEFCPKPVLYEL